MPSGGQNQPAAGAPLTTGANPISSQDGATDGREQRRKRRRETSERVPPIPERAQRPEIAATRQEPLPSLTSPERTAPSVASPAEVAPSITTPERLEPNIASPAEAAPNLTSPEQTAPSVASASEVTPNLAIPAEAGPTSLTSPEQTTPSIASAAEVPPNINSREPTGPSVGSPAQTSPGVISPVQTAPRAARLKQAAIRVTSPAQTAPEVESADPIAKIAGQMLIVGFDGTAPDEAWPKQIAAQIEAGKIGGVLLTGRNIQSPAQLTKLMAAFRRTKTAIPVFFAIEQSGGSSESLSPDKGFLSYPPASVLGKSNDPFHAYGIYKNMATEIASYGFNLNLGPVVDLDRSAENPAAAGNQSSYGSQPKHVAAFAKAFRLAHADEGLLTVLKNFPGYGRTKRETNDAMTYAENKWESAGLEPYRELASSGDADLVMVGHLAYSRFSDEPGLPASLSETAIARLRGDIGFRGVVVSDDLEMGDLSMRFTQEERIMRAIKAGNDILLIGNHKAATPDLPDRIAAIIEQAVATGTLSRDRLQASYDRILTLKQRLRASSPEVASAKRNGGDQQK